MTLVAVGGDRHDNVTCAEQATVDRCGTKDDVAWTVAGWTCDPAG